MTLGIELKVWRDELSDPVQSGLEQLDRYLVRLGTDMGWLVICDRPSNLPPVEERMTNKQAKTSSGRTVTMIPSSMAEVQGVQSSRGFMPSRRKDWGE